MFKGKPLAPPVVLSATYEFNTSDQLIDVAQHRTGYLYSRWDNPTVRELERGLAALEGYSEAVAFSSGMAAITHAVLAVVEAGARAVAVASYGETLRFFAEFLPRMGVECVLLGPDEYDRCQRELAGGASVLFLESPMNPLLRVVDIARWAESAHRHGVVVFLDATFASPVNLRPADLGVDVVIHSATKYLAGHHDVMGGIACCSADLHRRIWAQRRLLGGVMDPMTAFLVWRGLKTLEVRVNRQNQTAMTLARFLQDHPRVARVHYPGLPTHPDYAVARRQLRGFGGVVSFELDADFAGTKGFVDHLQVIARATSLGGVTSLVTQPVTNTHAALSVEQRAAAGIGDSLVRLSVGLEPAQLLIDDLSQALSQLDGPSERR
ncbi:MAG: trans-sulfuration enzyme family protein [Candidatus Bipolaricaulaceae bacterium]